MIIEIDDKEFGKDNYEYHIYINQNKVQSISVNQEKTIRLDNIGERDVVEIKATNIIFSSNCGMLVCFIYWVISIFSGYGEQNVFGKPFDGVLSLTSIKANKVKIKANSIWNENAFNINEKDLVVLKNMFVSTPQYRKKWFIGVVIPVNVLIIAIILLFAGVMWSYSYIKFLIGIPIIGCIAWNIYAFRVLKILTEK